MKNKFWAFPLITALLLCGCENSPTEQPAVSSSLTETAQTEKSQPQTTPEPVPADEASQPLTVEEYGRITAEYWQEYTDITNEINQLVNSSEGDFEKIKEMNGEIVEAHDRAEAVMDKFSEIAPPSEFEALHQKLVSSAQTQKAWIERQKEAYCADTAEEGNAVYGEILEEMEQIPAEDLFPAVYVKIRLKLQGLE
ncbi:MAG: DUF6376 family protein [Firmicutes bacterium]|nr:DUF6376 family protein [[Eubacterium] siraeum]MCM1488571.1 DUF6376 family protein [Bacillota bacterium]